MSRQQYEPIRTLPGVSPYSSRSCRLGTPHFAMDIHPNKRVGTFSPFFVSRGFNWGCRMFLKTIRTEVPVLLSLFVAFVAVGVSEAQSTTIPNTPAGQVLKAWLEAFNSGDGVLLDAYFRKHEPGKTVEREMPFRNSTGGFDLIEILRGERLQVEFMVKERNSETRAVGFMELKDAEPHQVATFLLRAIPPDALASDVNFKIDAVVRTQVIEGAIAKLNEFYVFPEVAQKMEEAVRARQKRGEYDAVTTGNAFAAMLTEHFREVSGDKHLGVNFSPVPLPDRPAGPNPNASAQYRRQMERTNCGFEKVEILSGNVGYLKFNMFADPEVCGPTAIAAMNFLANVDAIIFDLRDNGGGDPKMIALISTYLFSRPTHLNDLWERKDDKTQQYWTLPYVPGKRLDEKPAYVLTSRRTFSGAEEFSYNVQNLRRATIIGETTGGGAHPVAGHRINDRFSIGVPFARAINPISHTNWEGTGVEPDVKVAATEALSTAQRLAAEKLQTK
jgi:hypothetical protein